MPKAKTTKLNPKQELFCQLYVKNENSFGNGTRSYAEAYGYSIDDYKDDDGHTIRNPEYDNCKVNASQLLTKTNIQKRVQELLNEYLNDNYVDSQLSKVIKQDAELTSKMRAINEYNKLKQRIVDKWEGNNPNQNEAIEELRKSIVTMIENAKHSSK